MRCLMIIIGMLIRLNSAAADTNPQCRHVQMRVAEAFAFSLKAAGRDTKRLADAVDRELSRRAITREEIRKCDPNSWFTLGKIEDCARNNDQSCIITQKDLDEAEKTLESLENADALQAAYKNYAIVKYCNEVRRGYVAVYINEIELARARTAIKAIEENAIAKNRNLNTDALWRSALSEISRAPVSQYQ